MLYDLFSLTDEEYTDVVNNPEKHIIYYEFNGRKCARHGERGPHISSQKVDKKIFEDLRRDLKDTGSNTRYLGNFNGGSMQGFVIPHIKNKFILKLDIQLFFNSIDFSTFESVVGKDYQHLSAIKKIYFKPKLLVGLASSAVIAEKVIQKVVDNYINAFIHSKDEYKTAIYTRFYDDIYVSSNDKRVLTDLMGLIEKQLDQYGFRLNSKKTKIIKVENALILNNRINRGNINVGKKFKNNLRLQIHHYHPDTSSLEETYRTIQSLHALIGRLAYIVRVETSPSRKWVSLHNRYLEDLEEYKEIRDRYIYEGYE